MERSVYEIVGEPLATEIRGLIDAAREEGRKEAFRFAIACNQGTIKALEGNKIKTPYVLGAVNALAESLKDWEAIVSGAMVPDWRSHDSSRS